MIIELAINIFRANGGGYLVVVVIGEGFCFRLIMYSKIWREQCIGGGYVSFNRWDLVHGYFCC